MSTPHLSTLSCAPGDCPWWAVSLALRLLVGSGKWEILDVAGPEEGEEKGCISLVSSLPGHHAWLWASTSPYTPLSACWSPPSPCSPLGLGGVTASHRY